MSRLSLACFLLLALDATRAAAADPRIGAPAPLAFTPDAGLRPFANATGSTVFPLPGAEARVRLRVDAPAPAPFRQWLDATVANAGITGWTSAGRALVDFSVCSDGSTLGLERHPLGTESFVVHHTSPTASREFSVPASATNVYCAEGVTWLKLAETGDVLERYDASGQRTARRVTGMTGILPLLTSEHSGWLAITPGVPDSQLDAYDANGAHTTIRAGVVDAMWVGNGLHALAGTAQLTGIPEAPVEHLLHHVRLGADGAIVVTSAPTSPALFSGGVIPGTAAVDAEASRFYFATTTDAFAIGLAEVGVAAHVATAIEPGTVGYLRGATYELTQRDGTQRDFDAELQPMGAARSLSTARGRSLAVASGNRDNPRLVGREGDSGAIFRVTSTPRLFPLGSGGATHVESSADGSGVLLTRSTAEGAAYSLNMVDALAPLPALDGSVGLVDVGGVRTSVGFQLGDAEGIGDGLTYVFRRGEEPAKLVTVARPRLDLEGRRMVSMAADGARVIAVYTVGDADGAQHLDWVTFDGPLEQAEPRPLIRAFYKQENPRVTCDPLGVGGCLVVWEDYRKSAFDPDVYGARILPDGSTPDGDGFVISASPRAELEPFSIDTDDGGHFLVSWRELGARQDSADPSRIRGAWVRYDGGLEDPQGVDLSDEPLDESGAVLFDAKAGVVGLAYAYFDARPGVSSMQIARRELFSGKPSGESCASDLECSARSCVDGICCESSCREGCGRCNEPGRLGQCLPRAAGEASTADRCAPYVCDGTSVSCPSACSSDAQCAGSRCNLASGECEDPSLCPADNQAKNEDGSLADCGAYRCASGRCLDRCDDASACSGNAVCTEEGRCAAPPPPAEGGCNTGAGVAPSLWLMLSLGSLWRRRRAGAH